MNSAKLNLVKRHHQGKPQTRRKYSQYFHITKTYIELLIVNSKTLKLKNGQKP